MQLRTELDEARAWTYEGLQAILRDEVPITMTLGLAAVLIGRMVREPMFKEPVDGVIAACSRIARNAAESEDD